MCMAAVHFARRGTSTRFDMIPAFANGFVDSIKRALLEASRGVASSHHFHNVRAGIANILSLLEYDEEIGAAADRLTETAANYLNRHDIVSTTTNEQERRADADRSVLPRTGLPLSAPRWSVPGRAPGFARLGWFEFRWRSYCRQDRQETKAPERG
jgi:hypothetical protein